MQDLFAWIARELRRRFWLFLLGVAAAIAMVAGFTGWSWTGLIVIVLIVFFAGIGVSVLSQVLNAIGGVQKPRGQDDAR